MATANTMKAIPEVIRRFFIEGRPEEPLSSPAP
jgi:hypothetical protein